MISFSDEEILELEEDWKPMSREEVEAAIDADSRVQCYDSNRKYYKAKLLDECQFLSLIWHKIDDSRLLTPEKSPRTVRDVAKRMEGRNFKSLSRFPWLPRRKYKAKWFRKCRKIEKAFCYDKFYAMWLVMADEDEKYKAPPSAQYYIYDGCHRSLVLGKLLLEEKIEYRPVEAILINPKPEED